ncbi:MAG: hypothetical protein DSM107014_06150 [Gomphosphaeria aponina SAG 52.96 = DSM 107014]|uniref:SnoaL-like domain-containing protein n=1 Tax=Gomphosphaeria aponina SAG 52.96 = DSM 107014 TaxID=1521640 RepID=A0A941GUR4_9CHRO|nr:hypothetical protein [Gomphosphaeria aponina SAG 52.96 = DSM 107014]
MLINRLLSVCLAIFALNILGAEPATTQPNNEPPTTEFSPEQEGQITEAAVQELIDGIKLAGANKNVDEIIQYFAPFINSRVTIKTDAVTETIELNGIEEHRAYMENAYQTIQSSEALFDDFQINILSGGEMAKVYRTRRVNITTTEGKRLLVVSDSESRLALIDGKLQIVSIEETAEVDLRP